jgi:hypothetical protein
MFEQAFKNIDAVLWKEAGCATELDYTEQTSYLLFLKYLDGLELDKANGGGTGGEKVRLHSQGTVPLGDLGIVKRIRMKPPSALSPAIT